MEQIIVHAQVEPGKFQTLQQHVHSQKRSKIEKGTVRMLQKASLIGTNADKWAQAMLEARGIPGIRVLVGLLNLVNHCDSDSIDKACEIALTHNAFRLKTIRGLIQKPLKTSTGSSIHRSKRSRYSIWRLAGLFVNV
jgi:hypothetical protein